MAPVPATSTASARALARFHQRRGVSQAAATRVRTSAAPKQASAVSAADTAQPSTRST